MEAGWPRATNTSYTMAITFFVSIIVLWDIGKMETQALLQIGVIIHVPCLGEGLGACPTTGGSVINMI
jgi:hypothetical protein